MWFAGGLFVLLFIIVLVILWSFEECVACCSLFAYWICVTYLLLGFCFCLFVLRVSDWFGYCWYWYWFGLLDLITDYLGLVICG